MADCARCGEAVYAADRCECAAGVFHKQCFLCEACGGKLHPGILSELEGKTFCSSCVKKGKANAKLAASQPPPPLKPMVVTSPSVASPAWASAAAAGIGKPVTSAPDSELEDGEAAAAPPPAPPPRTPTPASPSPSSSAAAAAAAGPSSEAAAATPKSEGAKALAARFSSLSTSSPAEPKKPTPAKVWPPVQPSPQATPPAAAAAAAATAPAPAPAPSPAAAAASPAAAKVAAPKPLSIGKLLPGVLACPRCGKQVYMAEKVIGPGGDWHKACLSCAECKKTLNSGSVMEHKGEAYCKNCHSKSFGPKGYGYAQGGAIMHTQ